MLTKHRSTDTRRTLANQIDIYHEFVDWFANADPIQQREILGILWETNGARKSKLDGNRSRIVRSWRPTWRGLLATDG